MSEKISIPKSYYVGQEFIEDQNHEDAEVKILFYSPALLESFDIYINGKQILGNYSNGYFGVRFKQKLSKKLIEALLNGKSEQYIIGYVSMYLPRINSEILKQRYNSGHFLVKTFSTLDIFKLEVSVPCLQPEINSININWPPVISDFNPAKILASEIDEIFIRDFIDAGNSYLSGNYDDCIRKIITSVENSFVYFKLKPDPISRWQSFIKIFKNSDYSFNRIVLNKIKSEAIGRKTVSHNLLILYKLRNKIVHDKFRIRNENGWVCKKGIGTLNYLYQGLGLSKNQKFVDYISYLSGQFIMVDNLSKGQNLGYIKRRSTKMKEITEDQMIDSDEKMNAFIFNGLKIDEEEEKWILKNKVPKGYYA